MTILVAKLVQLLRVALTLNWLSFSFKHFFIFEDLEQEILPLGRLMTFPVSGLWPFVQSPHSSTFLSIKTVRVEALGQ